MYDTKADTKCSNTATIFRGQIKVEPSEMEKQTIVYDFALTECFVDSNSATDVINVTKHFQYFLNTFMVGSTIMYHIYQWF